VRFKGREIALKILKGHIRMAKKYQPDNKKTAPDARLFSYCGDIFLAIFFGQLEIVNMKGRHMGRE